MGSATLNLTFKVIGPIAPADFSTGAEGATSLNTAYGLSEVTDAHSTTSLVSSEPVVILGNLYMVLTYYDAQ